MSGFKYLAGTAFCMIAVVLGFIVVLGQFNLMVYPNHITALSLNTGENGVCQIEFLGEKVQLTVPELQVMSDWAAQNPQTLTENACRVLKSEGMAVIQAWDAAFKKLPWKVNLERLLNIFEPNGVPGKEWLQKGETGVWN